MKPLLPDKVPTFSAITAAQARYAAAPTRWTAELELWFAETANRTRLIRRRHLGPLVVQRPFYPEKDGTCHVYLLHPPGGVAGGDSLDMRFNISCGSRMVMTTPGATKFYRSEHGQSSQSASINVAPDAVCEYLPQEAIIFDGADATIDLRINLEGNATYVGWDFVCLGRPAADERFESGQFRQRTEITQDGRPLWHERIQLSGCSPAMTARYALAGHSTWGTMVYAGAFGDDASERVRAAIGSAGKDTFSVSQLERIVVCRYLGPHASVGKALFAQAWDALRTAYQGKKASLPRIWAT